MRRNIYNELKAWKESPRRKPLVLQGARQTGKTYILREFGSHEFERLVYFNFEEDTRLDALFAGNLAPKRILENLSVYAKTEITPGTSLLFFDEIQESNAALNSLKYFQEEANEYHIAAAGSLLGITLSAPKSFPVGKVNFLHLYPMTFFEFLSAMGEDRYRTLLEHKSDFEPLPAPFHEELIHLLRKYYFVGGMPEAVRHFADKGDLQAVRDIQKEILRSYALDFAKHAPSSDIPKLMLIWDAIPTQLARENKKFIFSAIKKSARAREYENALRWLENAGLIHKSLLITRAQQPLKGQADADSFKVYALDVGLLGAMCNVLPEIVVQGERLFREYEGAFVENMVAEQLVAAQVAELFYWKREGRLAEVDFVVDIGGNIYPLEVKAGIDAKSKSLKAYDDHYDPKKLIMATLKNFKSRDNLLNVPLYAIEGLSRWLSL